jgi:hypothetical protein
MFESWRSAHRAKGRTHLHPRWEAAYLGKGNCNNNDDIIAPSDCLASHS